LVKRKKMKKYENFKENKIIIITLLYSEVKNINEIIELLNNQKIEGASIIDASMIFSEFQLLNAFHKSINIKKTKSIYSELFYNLSNSKNVNFKNSF
jgi:hypothetical protein